MVIDTLELKITVDNKGTTARINNTTKSLKDLHKVISDINGAGGVNSTINGGGGHSSSKGGASSLAKNLTKSLNFGSMIAKLYFVRNVTKQLGQDLAKVVQYGIDYEETLNLWQTAMRDNISQARVFTSEMTKAYGISSATLMNYQATFKNMLAALGNISEATAYGLSEALTQMALDFSSLYNVSVESAMTKFQAVLSGQVRPIRTAGYDITEQTLFQLYQNLGGTKTVRQLNQTEKQLLRILAVYKQMERSGATGDLAKTITSSANQLRIMKEQGKEFATWIGVAFNTMLEKSGILVEINAWLYAGVALAKQFAIEMGYVEKDYGIQWSDDISDASDEFEKFKGKLLGFDKFQALASTSGDGVDIEQALLKNIQSLEGILDGTLNPAFERSLEILKMIGLELDEDGNIVGGFDELKERVSSVAKSLASVLVLIVLITKPWLGLAIAFEAAYLSNESFRNSVNKFISEGNRLSAVIGSVVAALVAWKLVKISAEIKLAYTVIQPLIISLGTLATSLITKLKMLASQFTVTQYAAAAMAALGFMVALNAARELFTSWDDMSGFEKAIQIFKILAGAALVAAAAIAVFHTSWSVGIAAGAIAAGIAVVYGAIAAVNAKSKELEYHADGGLATKGSLFYAGEAGPELVTQTSGGGSTIMNMKQLEDAVARGFIRGVASSAGGKDGGNIEVYVDGQRLFNIVRDTAKRNGYGLVKVGG